MKTLVDGALCDQAERFRLRYTCEHCAHFDATDQGCAEGYPNGMHREVRLETATALEFCKSFELV